MGHEDFFISGRALDHIPVIFLTHIPDNVCETLSSQDIALFEVTRFIMCSLDVMKGVRI